LACGIAGGFVGGFEGGGTTGGGFDGACGVLVEGGVEGRTTTDVLPPALPACVFAGAEGSDGLEDEFVGGDDGWLAGSAGGASK
jgi:hypothetical protein